MHLVDDDTVGVSVDETTTTDDLAAIAHAFGLPERLDIAVD